MVAKEIQKITETSSTYNHLEQMVVHNLLVNINREDKTVPDAIEKVIPALEQLVNAIVTKMKEGGRLFYIGSGTSGRLGIVDASECPPTFGVEAGLVIGLIAAGDNAMRKAVEFAEDDVEQEWKDLQQHAVSEKDTTRARLQPSIRAEGTSALESPPHFFSLVSFEFSF